VLWTIPNQLTIGRIALAAIFFVLLGLYDASQPVPAATLLLVAFGIYVLAGITDVLDGWLARRWNLTSAFGRIADPFVDKVLVVGAFAMLAGSNFAIPTGGEISTFEQRLPFWLTGRMVTGVQAWMVVVVMAREFIVSAVRGYSESQGIQFPATPAGKIKMFLQSAAICTILFQLAVLPEAEWAVVVKVVLVWLAVLATVLSGLVYVNRAKSLLVSDEQAAG
jgi:phosphatidylglycerophosphate synthase